MALGYRRGWVWGAVVLALIAAVLGWAWNDGGERPITAMSAPAMLPKVGQ